ncbi:hypothetical protein GCM10010376_96450 [Streptomyces violaceusniger]
MQTVGTEHANISAPIARNDHPSIEKIGAVYPSRRDVGTQTDRKPSLTENTSVAFRWYLASLESTL